jgi:predicted RNA polymerase sigma factor
MVATCGQITGSDEAIATLFCACYPQLIATGYGVARDWAVAEELAQQAFVRLWRRWRWIRDPGTVNSQTHKVLRQVRQQLAEPAAGTGQACVAEAEGQ